MALTLNLKTKLTLPIEVDGFTPSWARDKSIDEIAAWEVFQGNQKLPLGEFFDLQGSAEDLAFEFRGDLSKVHRIGAKLETGSIQIHGNAGRHVGSQMTGGSIQVVGDAGDWLGAEMRSGEIQVSGNAGNHVGAAFHGATKGMRGGTILIRGDAGNEIGLAMRRGMIAIGGKAGDMLGYRMLAGTIFAFGGCGLRPGAEMKRGTIGLFGSDRPALLPTFAYACSTRLQILPMLFSNLTRQGFPIDKKLSSSDFEVHHGDLLQMGKGEILFPAN